MANSLNSILESGRDPFTESTFFNNETIPPKFTDPLPDSQRQDEVTIVTLFLIKPGIDLNICCEELERQLERERKNETYLTHQSNMIKTDDIQPMRAYVPLYRTV